MSDDDPQGGPTVPPTVPGKRARRDVPVDSFDSPSSVATVEPRTRPTSGPPPAPPGSTANGADGDGPRPKPQRSTLRRVIYWIGVGMILAGLGLLAYVAWQLWGTNWISKRHQREITSQLQEDWSAGKGCSVNCPEGQATALIRIPRFGKDYVVPVLEGGPDNKISADVLARGFGHFAETAAPGGKGNYALAAHRVTHGEPLRHMPDLRPGDRVLVDTRTRTYVYELDTNPNDLVISFTGIWVLDVLPHNPNGGPEPKQVKGQKLITLTTCSELFHTDNRMVAFGHLIATRTRGKATTPAG